MRKSIILPALLLSLSVVAQNTPDTTFARLSAISSLGIGVVDKAFDPTITNSTQTTTGLEYRFSPRMSIIGVLSFDSYGYKTSGTGYNLSGRLRSTGFDFSLRYKLATGTLQPYLKAGGGALRFSIPTVNMTNGTSNIENKVEVVGMYTGEAGLQFRAFKRFWIFAGAEREWVSESDLLNIAFRVTTFKLGLVTSF